jgi:AraC-like DNA-binding protein
MNYGISHIYHYYQNCDEFGITSAVPDGCVDIYFDKGSDGLLAKVCGTVLKRTNINNQREHEYFGIRFMPGVIPANLNINMKDLINKELELADVIKDSDIIKKMEETKDWQQCISLLIQEHILYLYRAGKRQDSEQKRLLKYFIEIMISSMGSIKIKELSEKTGYSARYVNMIFDQYLGFSPKTFEKIIQLQNSINIINHHQSENLTQIGMDAGYFDQAHFIREFKKQMSMTPAEYRKLVREHSYLQRMSVEMC